MGSKTQAISMLSGTNLEVKEWPQRYQAAANQKKAGFAILICKPRQRWIQEEKHYYAEV